MILVFDQPLDDTGNVRMTIAQSVTYLADRFCWLWTIVRAPGRFPTIDDRSRGRQGSAIGLPLRFWDVPDPGDRVIGDRRLRVRRRTTIRCRFRRLLVRGRFTLP
jgi:hypothetical protein